MVPAMTDACDTGTPGMAACGDLQSGCVGCSVGAGALCAEQYNTCVGDTECVDFSGVLQDCPQN